MVDILSLVLHHDEQSVLCAVEMALEAGVPTKTHVLTQLPALVVAECQDLLLQISEQTARLETKTKLLARVAASSETARRLQTMPGVGPMAALAVEAFAPD